MPDLDPYFDLPGTSGIYLKTEDVNLLDADTAHVFQSRGFWDNFTGSGSAIQVADSAAPYGYALRTEANGTSNRAFAAVSGDATESVAATAATTYTLALYCRVTGTGGSVTVAYRASWLDAGFSGISSNDVTLAGVADDDGYALLVGQVTSPANTAWLRSQTYMDTLGGNLPNGARLFTHSHMVAEGTLTTFVPSLRIVGDLDIEADIAADDWTTGTDQWIISHIDTSLVHPQGGWGFLIRGDGRVATYYNTTNSMQFPQLADPGLTDGARYTLRMKWDTSGSYTVAIDGVDQTPIAVNAEGGLGTIQDPADAYLGSLGGSVREFGGKVYGVTVRDGIDGPIVASLDPADVSV